MILFCGMKSLLLLLFPLLALVHAHSQEVTISGSKGNRPLEWSDFKGQPDRSSPYFANTRWNIGYTMPNIRLTGDSVPLTGFMVKLELDSKGSWVKTGKESPGLLKHEQGHFDIGRLCQLELVSILNKTYVVPAQLSTRVGGIFKTVMDKYHAMGVQYDQETDHNLNAEAQEKWNRFLASELARLEPR